MLMHCLNQPLKLFQIFQQNILGSFAQNTIALVPCPVKNSGIMSTSPCWVCVYPLHPLKPTRSPGTWLTTSWSGLVEVVKMMWGSPNTWPGSPIRCIRAIATKRIVISTECFQMASPARWWKPPWCLAVVNRFCKRMARLVTDQSRKNTREFSPDCTAELISV